MARILLELLFVGVCLPTVLVAQCPKNVLSQAENCMSVNYGNRKVSIWASMVSNDKKAANKLCEENNLKEAFQCSQKLYEKCSHNRDDLDRMGRTVNIRAWENATQNLCLYAKYIKDNAECESRANAKVEPCVEHAVNQYKDRLSDNSKISGHQRDRSTDKFRVTCVFAETLMQCYRDAFQEFCPVNLTRLFVNTLYHFSPPGCNLPEMRVVDKTKTNTHKAQDDQEKKQKEEPKPPQSEQDEYAEVEVSVVLSDRKGKEEVLVDETEIKFRDPQTPYKYGDGQGKKGSVEAVRNNDEKGGNNDNSNGGTVIVFGWFSLLLSFALASVLSAIFS